MSENGPAFVIIAIVAAVSILTVFVLPILAQWFANMKMELPLLRQPRWRCQWDRLKLRLPIVGSITLEPGLLVVMAVLAGLLSATRACALELESDRIDLSPHVEFLEDPGGKLSVDQLASPEWSSRFKPWSHSGGQGTPNFGYTESAYWLRVALARGPQAREDWLLVMSYASLGEVDLYAPGQAPVHTGADRPVGNRPHFDVNFVFPVELGTSEQHHYLRVRSSSPLTLELTAWKPNAYQVDKTLFWVPQFLYYGGLLALLLYNLLLYLSLRDLRFLHYSLYALALGLAMMAGNGHGRLFLWPELASFDQIAQNFFLSLMGLFALLFSRSLLRLGGKARWLDGLQGICGGFFAAIAAALLCSLQWPLPLIGLAQLLSLNGLMLVVLNLVAGIRSWLGGFKGARFFVLAWAILSLGVITAAGRGFGWLPTNSWTAYAIQISSAVEMLLLSLALADIIREERRAREAAQSQALAAQVRMLELLKSSEGTLERAVRERTAQLETALRHEKEMMAQYLRFGSLISHEFRNPLGILASQLSLLSREHAQGLDHIDKRVEVMERATRRLLQMFDKWLKSSRLVQLDEEFAPHAIPLQQWLRLVIDGNDYCLARHSVELHLSAGVMTIEADEYLLETALSNLLENAAKYSAPGTVIAVETRVKPGHVGIAVIDQGRGIAAELQQQVFLEYFRVDPEGPVSGMGLGLSIVQRITELHGGHMQVDSAPGQGSCLCIWLPQKQ